MNEITLVITGGLLSIVPTWFTLRYHAKQHRRELAVKIALELWQRGCVKTDTTNTKIDDLPDALPGLKVPNMGDPDFTAILDAIISRLDGLK